METTKCFNNDNNAKIYDNNSSLQHQWANHLISQYADIIKSSKRIIDIGCGSGKITSQLANLSPDICIYGIDMSSAMINYAKQKYYNENKINFFVEDVEKMSYSNEFDAVFSCCCLQWLPDQKNALAKICESLKSGGNLFIVIPTKDGGSIFPIGKKISENDTWKKFFVSYENKRSYYSNEEYTKLLTTTGFTVRSIDTINSETIFENRDKLYDWIKPICSYKEFLPAELQQKFMDDVVENILSKNTYSDKIAIHAACLQVHATK